MKIAVIIPCLNEAVTIGKVVEDSLRYLPGAEVYVLNNGSSDTTAANAAKQGARVIFSPLRGKGHVLRHAFRVIDADYYVMVDGDGTYPMDHAPKLIEFAREHNYEMVMGARLELGKPEAFRPLHYFGNRLFTKTVRFLFHYPVHDLLTGFRVFSRRFVEQTQLLSRGFEVETELTIRAVAQDLAFAEVAIPYRERPANSRSKLRTFRDGWVILRTIFKLWKTFQPLAFFTIAAAVTGGLSLLATPYIFGPLAALFMALGFHLDSRLIAARMRRQARRPQRPARLKRAA